jgi:cell division protein YceG involved in septum cleavage
MLGENLEPMSTRPPAGRRAGAAPPEPAAPQAQKLPPHIIVLAIFLIVLSFGFGYGALTVRADIATPVASGNVSCSPFAVTQGESSSAIIDRLQQQHLIRNALVAKIYLKLSGKTLNVKQGSYCLSPSMRLQDIINALSASPAPTPSSVIHVNQLAPA